MSEERIKKVLAGISHTGYTTELERTAARILIEDLQQKVEQLEKENEELKQPQVFIDCEDMEERYGRDLYEDYLKEKIEQLENIRKEVIEEIQRVLDIWTNKPDGIATLDLGYLLNILNKGSK